MRVLDRFDVWPSIIDGSVKRVLRRRPVQAIDSSVRFDADDIVSCRAAFIDPSRRNPNFAMVIANRKIAAGRRRHAIAIEAIHRLHNGITWMYNVSL